MDAGEAVVRDQHRQPAPGGEQRSGDRRAADGGGLATVAVDVPAADQATPEGPKAFAILLLLSNEGTRSQAWDVADDDIVRVVKRYAGDRWAGASVEHG